MVQIEVIGNLGADVREVDYNGNKFYSFNVCDNRKVNGREISQWYTCNINRQSEVLQYLVKGQQVFVRGLPTFGIFDSPTYHCKMVKVDIFVNEIQLLGGAPKPAEAAANNEGETPAPAGGEETAATAAPQETETEKKKSNGRKK